MGRAVNWYRFGFGTKLSGCVACCKLVPVCVWNSIEHLRAVQLHGTGLSLELN